MRASGFTDRQKKEENPSLTGIEESKQFRYIGGLGARRSRRRLQSHDLALIHHHHPSAMYFTDRQVRGRLRDKSSVFVLQILQGFQGAGWSETSSAETVVEDQELRPETAAPARLADPTCRPAGEM